MAHLDPFASIALKAGTHPALSESHHLSSDIYPALFNWFFASREFNRWSSRESTWQLHCIGGPGSGKVLPCSIDDASTFKSLRPPNTTAIRQPCRP